MTDRRDDQAALDEEVGFCTPQSLAGRVSAPVVAEHSPDMDPVAADDAEVIAEPAPAMDRAKASSQRPAIFAAAVDPQASPFEPRHQAAPSPFPAVAEDSVLEPWPDPALRTPQSDFNAAAAETAIDVGGPPAAAAYGRRRTPQPIPDGGPLFLIYALTLLALPTAGASAALALLLILGRSAPENDDALSHFIYQRRTLFTAALAAVLGLVLIVVGLGVFVLFALALWVTARTVHGLFKLKAGRAIDRPRSWLF